jgi:hypothetical protein
MSLRDALLELARRWHDLPWLVGPHAWAALAPTAEEYVDRLRAASSDAERALLARDLILLFKPYPAVTRLLTEPLERAPTRSIPVPSDETGGEPGWELVTAELSERVPHPAPTPSAEYPDEAPPEPAITDRRINVWVSERPEELRDPLWVGQDYTLKLQVGPHVPASLIDDPAAVVLASDVPPGGLDTTWVLSSFDVELASVTPDVEVTPATSPTRPWTAQFALQIPAKGPSATRQIRIVPWTVGDTLLEVLVYAGTELYRQFKVRFATKEAEPQTKEAPTAEPAATINDDLTHVPVAHLQLPATHEWTTPPGKLSIAVGPGRAFVMGEIGTSTVRRWTDWHGAQAQVAGRIKNARMAAERFRSRWEGYLNDVDPDDLEQRLQEPVIPISWQALPDQADAAHQRSWVEVARSAELRDLAFDGHALYESFFPPDSELRAWIDALPAGQLLDITWVPSSDQGGWIPHVPWGLMYLDEAPPPGDPVDPMAFLGLRFRLGYQTHEVPLASKALGGLEEAYRANLLYWGDQQGDETGAEARWQKARLTNWHNQVFLAVPEGDVGPKHNAVGLGWFPVW